MQIDVSRFRAAFYVEASEHLQLMEAALLQLESSPRDTELLNTIFRGAHSIKGASTTFGIDEVGRFTHVLENLLERLRDGLLETTGPLVELLLTSVDRHRRSDCQCKGWSPTSSELGTGLSGTSTSERIERDPCEDNRCNHRDPTLRQERWISHSTQAIA